jgi:hypothetical protein
MAHIYCQSIKVANIFYILLRKAKKYLCPISLFVFLVINSGCSDGPREQYTNLCLNIAKSAKQMQSCSCLAYEYGKVLTTEEYRTVNKMLARAIQDLKERDGDLASLPPDINREGIDEKVFVSAMQKITILQRSQICGYALE